MGVRLSRRELLITVAVLLPSFILGEWLWSCVSGDAFNRHKVFDVWWGALILAMLLIFTRGTHE